MITIGLPFCDRLAPLKCAVNSVMNQSHTDWRLILAGDGPSTDCREWALSLNDSRIRVHIDDQSHGLPYQLNQIAALCDTPFLARMDDDDLMHPQRLERQLEALLADRRLDLCATHAYAIDPNNGLLGRYLEPPAPRRQEDCLRSNAYTHPTVMAKAEWFRKNPYRTDLRRSQDKELWLRTFQTCTSKKLDDYLLYYRISPQRNSRMYAESARLDRQILREYSHLQASKIGLWRDLTTSKVKQAITTTSSGFVQDWLFQRRFRSLAPSQRRDAESGLQDALA